MVCNDSRSSGQEARLIYAVTLPLSTAIVLANLPIFLGVACSRRLRNPAGYFYLSLLVADLGMGVGLPFIPWMALVRTLSFSACLLVHVSPNFLFLAFVSNLVLVHYDRYVSIVSPLHRARSWLHRRLRLALLAAWLLPLLFALMPVFGWNGWDGRANATAPSACARSRPSGRSCCTYRSVFPDAFIYLEVYGVLVPAVLAIAGMTGRVLWITRGQLRGIQRLERAVGGRRRRLEVRYVRCVAAVSLAFLACWAPYIVYTHVCMVFLLRRGEQGNSTAHIVLLCTGVAGMTAVPLLLGLANRDYTNTARRLVGKLWYHKSRAHRRRSIDLRVLAS
ncbi:G-protein coupled bile acid receptor 1 [Brachyhypopomus gauderio]|uniref:G-protein coupled bile acid receptor 1 n=1 Tax=Brachyhypopomus gauderio TaxID=698409 RepID=UPI004041CA32